MRSDLKYRINCRSGLIFLAWLFVIVFSVFLLPARLIARGANFADENVDVIYYVKPGGDDSHTGTDSTQALASVSEALEKAVQSTRKGLKAGVYVYNGTYEWDDWGVHIPFGTTLLKLEGESKGGVIIDAAKMRGNYPVIEATAYGNVYSRKNLIFRNIIIENAKHNALEIGVYALNDGLPDNNNILIQDCEFNNSGERGLVLWHCDSTTVKGVKCKNNGTWGCKTFLRNSIVQDCEFSNNAIDGIWFGTHNTLFRNIVCNDNTVVGFRMDHICTDTEIDSLYTSGNEQGAVFEVAEGPFSIRNSTFENNNVGLTMSTVHGMQLYNCLFLNNTLTGLHVSNKQRDEAHTDCTPGAGWKCMASSGKVPVGQPWHSIVPLNWNKDTKIDSCRFSTNMEYGWLIAKVVYDDHLPDAHYVWARDELKARNNTYYASYSDSVFDLLKSNIFRNNRTLTDWKAVVEQGPSTRGAWDETHSVWAPLGPLPNSPDSLKASSVFAGQITLAWNDVDVETGYAVLLEQSSGNITIATLGSNVTNYKHSGLTASKKYSYRVKALNKYGAGYSEMLTVTTSDLPQGEPAAPTDLKSTLVSANRIDLEWVDNTHNEAGYKIERKEGDNGSYALFAILDADVTKFSDTWIQESKIYYYKVYAFNGKVNSDFSNELQVSTSTQIEIPNNMQGVIPAQCVLYQNYPNPFNLVTYIRFDLAFDADVDCSIYDMLGRKVKTLISGRQTAGYKTVTWNSLNEKNQNVASGIYIYRINAVGKNQSYVENRKIILIR